MIDQLAHHGVLPSDLARTFLYSQIDLDAKDFSTEVVSTNDLAGLNFDVKSPLKLGRPRKEGNGWSILRPKERKPRRK